MDRLKNRGDFLRAAGGAKWATPGFVLQARRRRDDGMAPRTGFTASRKVGGAVARNRARRRLKEAVRLGMAEHARAGHDYVLIARRATLTHSFHAMVDELRRALHIVHQRLDAGVPSRADADRQPTRP